MVHQEFPKWVPVDETHILRRPLSDGTQQITTPHWPNFTVDRYTGQVSVLVENPDQEFKATTPKESH